MCTHAGVHALGGQRFLLGTFPNCSPAFFLETRSAGSSASFQFRDHRHAPWQADLTCTWGLNSGSQACARSPSLAQPSPKPPFWLCGFLFFKKMTQAFTVTQASLLYSASQTLGIQACPLHLVYPEVGTEPRASCPLGRAFYQPSHIPTPTLFFNLVSDI